MEWLCPHEKKHNEHVIWRLYSLCEEIRGQFQTTIGFKINSVLAVTFICFNYHQTVRDIFLLYLGILLIHISRGNVFSVRLLAWHGVFDLCNWIFLRVCCSYILACEDRTLFLFLITPPGHPQLPLVPLLDSKLIGFFLQNFHLQIANTLMDLKHWPFSPISIEICFLRESMTTEF